MPRKEIKIITNICVIGIILSAPIMVYLLIMLSNGEAFAPQVHKISENNIEQIPRALLNVHKIVCIGDSITLARYPVKGYVTLLRDYLHAIYPKEKIEVINAGVNGNRSFDLVNRFKKDALDENPDLIVINVGVNDVIKDFSNTQLKADGVRHIEMAPYLANFKNMFSLASLKHIRVIILSPTTIMYGYSEQANQANQVIEQYSAGLENLAQNMNIKFVNLFNIFAAMNNSYYKNTGVHEDILTNDGVHPNQLGQLIIAQSLMTALGVPSVARAQVR